MAENNEWANSPPLRSRLSQQSFQSIVRSPLRSSGHTPHRRTVSDNVSMSIRPQAEEGNVGFTRQDPSTPAKSRLGGPIMEAATGPYSTPAPSPGVWSDGGDLGSRSPVDGVVPPILSPELESTKSNPRSRPTPFQFEDNTSYVSPAPSSGSVFSPLGRFGQRDADSRTNLLNTPSTPWRSPRTPPAYAAALPSGKRRCWYWWRQAWIMYVMFFSGLAFAVGHHAFYQTLDDQPADDQLAMLRYGTGLAFATKACLVSAVIVAYRQRIWTTVRSKMLSVAALDSLFAATEDLSALWNLEVYRRAKAAIALAILVWLAPLVIVLTSNTLGVEPAFRVDNSTCLGVRTLNFDKEGLENWRDPTKIDRLIGLSVSIWNSTTLTNTTEGWFDYYTSYSEQFEQIARMTAYRQQVASREGAGVEICGSGWNCTYVVNFTAPGYRCEELASGVGSEIRRFGDHDPPRGFNTTLLLPEGNYSYYAYTNGGDYASSQMADVWPGGMPKEGPPFPKNLGAFRTEPVLWIGYSERADPDRVPVRTEPGWDEAFVPKIFACENYETEYAVRFRHAGGQQTTEILERRPLSPVIGTKWLQGARARDGTNDNTTAYPESSYVYPTGDKRHYRRVAAFHSIGAVVRYFASGTVDSGTVGNPIADTKAVQTKLLDRRHEWFPHPDLMRRVQSLAEDVVLSILSDPQFVAVVWAARPDESSGAVGAQHAEDDHHNDNNNEEAWSTRYPCERSRAENRYRYYASTLWSVYGVAMLVTAAGVASGTRAVLGNEGRLRDTRFSSIVAATRGPALEKVGWGGAPSPGGPAAADLPPDVRSLRVGYGLVHGGGGGGAVSNRNSSNYNGNNYNALGVTNNHVTATTTTNVNGPYASSATGYYPSHNHQHHQYDPLWSPERASWGYTAGAGDVRYGFGLEGDVSQIRSEGSVFRGRSRG